MLRKFNLIRHTTARDHVGSLYGCKSIQSTPGAVRDTVDRRKYMYWLFYRARLQIAGLQLRLVARCHRDLSNLINIMYPSQSLQGEDDGDEATGELADWAPTKQSIFAIVPPDHHICGPGHVRKLRP